MGGGVLIRVATLLGVVAVADGWPAPTVNDELEGAEVVAAGVVAAEATGGRLSSALARNPLPPGTLSVGVGLAVTGIASYGFLVIAARYLGPVKYGGLSVLWALVFLIAGGVFLPLEQEVSRRIVGQRLAGRGGGGVVRRIGMAGLLMAGLLIVVTLALSPVLVSRLFSGDWLLLVGLIVGTAGYMVANFVEGVLSGHARFGRYGVYLGTEALLRLAICVGCVALGSRTPGPFGLALGIAPLAVAVPVLWGQHELIAAGPSLSWGEVRRALGALLAGSVLSQVLINASPIVVQLLARPSESAVVGVFTAAVVVTRVPLFLFQALQATLLPRLSTLAESQRFDEFGSAVLRLVLAVSALVVAGVVGGVLVGSSVITTVFGSDFRISRVAIGLLATGSGCYMLTMAMGQALIALGRAGRVALGWGAGVIAMGVGLIPGGDLVNRVGLALVAGTGAAALVVGSLLGAELRRSVHRSSPR